MKEISLENIESQLSLAYLSSFAEKVIIEADL